MALLIAYALLSILTSFVCSVLEAVLLSVTPTFIRIKTKEGKAYAQTLANFKKDIDKPLIAILTLNTVAHTVGAILVGVQAEKAFGNGDNAVGIVSAVMTVLILVISEIIPKTIGATYWKSLANISAKILKAIIFPLKYTGILWVLLWATKVVGKSGHTNTMSREEFMAITDAAEKEGVFKENESNFIRNLLVYQSVLARDVMTPFSVVVTEDETITVEEFVAKHHNIKFSRIPVYNGKTNNITGFVLKDDVLEEMIDEKGKETLSSLKRDVTITPSDTPVPKVFEKFIEKRTHMAMVTDEYGNMVGLISMEDIIETLLGLEIMDESDNVADMQLLARQNWEKRAKRLGILSQLNDQQSANKKSSPDNEKS